MRPLARRRSRAEFKYIRTSRSWNGIRLFAESEQLYDLPADAGERDNLVDSLPAVLERFRAAAAPYWAAWFEGRARADAQRSPEMLERLRALDYVD